VGVDSLPKHVAQAVAAAPQFSGAVRSMRAMQREYAAWALTELQGHKRHTCEALEIDLKTLNRLLSEREDQGGVGAGHS
jgi:DNA-binding NtrC family response regulator